MHPRRPSIRWLALRPTTPSLDSESNSEGFCSSEIVSVILVNCAILILRIEKVFEYFLLF
ncbi:hypothetical protein SDJN02_26324, partial [Cucurbita argyrosperma subsp. argyrosperma]